MTADLGTTGSVIVYYQSFEIGRLRDLKRDFPHYETWASDVIGRIVDLHDVFKRFAYYHPDQRGSASLKAVLPALTDLTYEGMEIGQGDDASLAFLRLREAGDRTEDYDDEMQRLKAALIDYCKQDTLSMVELLRRLKTIIGDGR